MAKIRGYHLGDLSENLAEYAFGTVGFCVPVPRQNDYFYTDMLLHLAQPEEKLMIPMGMTLGIQVKSNYEQISIGAKEQDRNAFHESALPFFLAVISKKTMMLQVFATTHRLKAHWQAPDKEVVFTFSNLEARDDVSEEDLEDRYQINLGAPIYETDDIRKLSDLEEAKNFYATQMKI